MQDESVLFMLMKKRGGDMRAGPSHLGVIAVAQVPLSPPVWGDEVRVDCAPPWVSLAPCRPNSVYGGTPRFVEAPLGLTAFCLPGQYKWECTETEGNAAMHL